jgi:plasmid stabilization system protein ParE
MIVEITAQAQADLEAIADYIARDSPVRAIRFVQALRAKCLDLAEMPLAFPLVPRYEHHGVRRRIHGDYLIFYQAGTDRVIVYHVLHGAMDYAALLFPE